MGIVFDIKGNPPSKESILGEQARLRRLVNFNRYSFLPFAFLVVFAAVKLGKLLPVLLLEVSDLSQVPVQYTFQLLIIYAFVIFLVLYLLGLYLNFGERIVASKEALRVMEKRGAPILLKLAENFPLIDTYCKTVTATREITQGEYEAMYVYSENEKRRIRAGEIESKHNQAFNNLHRLSKMGK